MSEPALDPFSDDPGRQQRRAVGGEHSQVVARDERGDRPAMPGQHDAFVAVRHSVHQVRELVPGLGDGYFQGHV